ncbi:CapA family protein [Streptomyces sp. NBC_01808]|uniref:CapA family protein n=1 Tax=Streptomyces sp. NBC_01808 TaxID=2975947 RepID=UPI002DD97A96|nr:CapA family protein [Streptomyces sp. NBC_01808]WSA36249.1 CapA family protein [Streptomyces sp. NBC_01808]
MSRRRTRLTAAAGTATALAAAAALLAAGCAPADRSAAPAAAGPGPDARPFTLLATGDVIPYPSIMTQAATDAGGEDYDFRPMFAAVAPTVAKADLALCHLETPLGPREGPFTGYPSFQSPPGLAAALRDVGYDGCSTASNHALDSGTDGVRRTLDALDDAGLRYAGTARTRAESGRAALLSAGGARVAHLSYTYGSNAGVPADAPWSLAMLDPHRVVADARAVRRAGADVVVVSVHWGTEWQQEPDLAQRRLADRLTRSRSGGRKDIDLIVGTHNHVPQPYEKVNGTWVVYGLGDQVASFIPSMYRGNEGSAARFTFTPARDGWQVTRAEFLAQHAETGPPFRVVPATPETYPDVHARVRAAVLSRGAAEDGLREASF